MKFNDLNINRSLLNALEDMSLETPTSIQTKVFSEVMSGKDLAGIAKTGTGKTIAYLLPLIRMWNFSKEKLPQIVILVPTRELVVQVQEVAKKLTSYISFDTVGVYGGVNIKTQIIELQNGCDLLVATPGRFIDLAAAGVLKVKNIKRLVLDEFDTMLDLGFRPQLEQIFDKVPEKRQNLLFSATVTEDIEALLEDYFKSPSIIEDDSLSTPHQNINQRAYILPNFESKINLLEVLLSNDPEMTKNLIFVSEKGKADILLAELQIRGIESVDIIHSNKSQNYRFNAISKFSEGETRTLIATDIGSRGLDIPMISHVVNMDLTDQPEDYIHRIGRTGRASQNGKAISLLTEKENTTLEKIEELLNYKISKVELPKFLEISDQLFDFEKEYQPVKFIKTKTQKIDGVAFHEKSEKNKKVNKKRNIEKEKQKKYGKAYKKEIKPS
ncbi:MAG: DEAD/DEAH box helicase [Cytophagaceae bacterium]|nr:DEAD/DEAH box helicase [Cytophagaceae bacterium]